MGYRFVGYLGNKKLKTKMDLNVIRRLGIFNQDKNAKILELFCGWGELQELLKDAGYLNVFGSDISETWIRQVRQDCHVLVCNSLGLCHKSNSFDFVFVNEGLHHLIGLEQMKKCFDEVKMVLRKNGIFAFYEPANTHTRKLLSFILFSPLSNLFKKTRLIKDELTKEMPEYSFWLRNIPQILELLEDRGFCVEKYNKTLMHISVILRLKQK